MKPQKKAMIEDDGAVAPVAEDPKAREERGKSDSGAQGASLEGTSVPPPLDLENLTAEDVVAFGQRMETATQAGPLSLRAVLPTSTLMLILERALARLKAEPTLVEIQVVQPGTTVTVVGDTHGQYHDVLEMFRVAGLPSHSSYFIMNGDFVDRGAWSVETLVLFLLWKLLLPDHVTLLRGNHESVTCNQIYGFRSELAAKYEKESKGLYKICKSLFAALPLGALVHKTTLVLHGGLFRKHTKHRQRSKGRKQQGAKRKQKGDKVKESSPGFELGTLEDLRSASKGGVDPHGYRSSTVATDVLWSDPVAEKGLSLNVSRGVGLVFGPDATDRFLRENNLRLVIRSHEGPDARDRRDDMPDMLQGHSIDHDVDAGKLMTVFSAPDYPQFMEGEERYNNTGAVVVLREPDYAIPEIKQFSAVLPRPDVEPYYDFSTAPESDEEIPQCAGLSETGSEAHGSELSEQSVDGASSQNAHEGQEMVNEREGSEDECGIIQRPNDVSLDCGQPASKRLCVSEGAVVDPEGDQ